METDEDLSFFEKDFFIINPNGSSYDALCVIDYCVANKTRSDGKTITYDWLKKKYKQYIEYWDITFGSREQKFIGKNDKKKTIEEYVSEETYNITFEINLNFPERDPFLFGDNNLKTLKTKVDYWRKKLNDKVWTPSETTD